MVSLIIQTVLLVAIAFILGTVLGCLLRNFFGQSEDVQGEQTPGTSQAAVGTTAAVGAAGVASMEASSSTVAKTASAPVTTAPTVPKPPIPTKPVQPAEKPTLSETKKPEAKSAVDTPIASSLIGGAAPTKDSTAKASTVKPKKAKAEPTKPEQLKTESKAPAATTKAKATQAAAISASADADKPKAEAKAASKAPSKAKSSGKAKSETKAVAPAATPAAVADNLKEIRGIGPQNEGRLNALGVNSFAQIAAWKRKDEAIYGEVLAFPGRIEREDWVGQAKVLAKGGTTDFSTRVSSGSVASSQGKAKGGDMGTKPKSILAAPRGGTADNLTLIDGVGNAIEKKMFKLGIYHFDQIAKMNKAELAWLGNNVGFPGRPERENWAGEAKVLAAGGTTAQTQKGEKGQIKTSRKSKPEEK